MAFIMASTVTASAVALVTVASTVALGTVVSTAAVFMAAMVAVIADQNVLAVESPQLRLIHAGTGAAGIDQIAVGCVVAEEQCAEVRSRLPVR